MNTGCCWIKFKNKDSSCWDKIFAYITSISSLELLSFSLLSRTVVKMGKSFNSSSCLATKGITFDDSGHFNKFFKNVLSIPDSSKFGKTVQYAS